MTPKKAVPFINCAVLTFCGNRVKDKPKYYEALRIALEALEKQTPKKVVSIQRTAHDFEDGVCKHSHYPCEYLKPFDHEYKYTDYKCPVCGKLTKDGTPDFCWNCGQALDWSDEE